VSPPSANVNPTGTSGEYYYGTNVAGVIAAQAGNPPCGVLSCGHNPSWGRAADRT
jgi:hypothetical protein